MSIFEAPATIPMFAAVVMAVFGLISRGRIQPLVFLLVMGLLVSTSLLFLNMEFLGLLVAFSSAGFASVGFLLVTSLERGSVRFDWKIVFALILMVLVLGLVLHRFFIVGTPVFDAVRGAHDVEELGKEMLGKSIIHVSLLAVLVFSSLVGVLCVARLETRRKY